MNRAVKTQINNVEQPPRKQRFEVNLSLDCPWCQQEIAAKVPLNLANYQPSSPQVVRLTTLAIATMRSRYIAEHECPGP